MSEGRCQKDWLTGWRVYRLGMSVCCLLLPGAVRSVAMEGHTNRLVPVLSLDVSERFDSNVMLQNEGGQADQESFVTSVLPVLGGRLTGEGATPYSVELRYAPDFSFYHDLSRESYLRHNGLLNFDVAHRKFSADGRAIVRYTDGTTDPPTWGTVADGDQVPALGATEVRGRRRNAYYNVEIAARQTLGNAFARAVFHGCVWDFMTDYTSVPGLVIQNYYDRTDINGGVDVGYDVHASFEPYVGYRYGHQDQPDRVGGSINYANDYHRILFGMQSRPLSWLSFQGEIGPSIHCYNASAIPAGMDRTRDYLYFAASATLRLSDKTTFSIVGGENLLPASAGEGVFQNLTAAGTLSHRFASKWRGSFQFAFTDYDFDATFIRHDQRFIPKATLQYVFNRHVSAMVSYAYEWAINLEDVPNGYKREYTRNLAEISLRLSY